MYNSEKELANERMSSDDYQDECPDREDDIDWSDSRFGDPFQYSHNQWHRIIAGMLQEGKDWQKELRKELTHRWQSVNRERENKRKRNWRRAKKSKGNEHNGNWQSINDL